MPMTTQQASAGDVNPANFIDKNTQARRSGTSVVFELQSPLGESLPWSTEYSAGVTSEATSDFTFTYNPSPNEWHDLATHILSRLTDAPWHDRSQQAGYTVGFPLHVRSLEVEWPSQGAAVIRSSALINTLALEQNAIGFDPPAAAILGRIFDRGHATCEDLADWLESPEEWIAFSRLQRARLLYDSGTEFTVSPAGRRLIREMLSEGDAE